eukprot:409769_1
MGAKHSKVAVPTPISSNTFNITSKLLSTALFDYLYHDVTQYGIDLPSDLIILCLQMVGVLIYSSILSSNEEIVLFDHLKSKKNHITENLICNFELLYSQRLKEVDKKTIKKELIEVIDNRCNLLYIINTEFDHIISIFAPHVPLWIDHPNKDRDKLKVHSPVFIYLLRSQFESTSCPSEVIRTIQICNYYLDTEWHFQWSGIHFGKRGFAVSILADEIVWCPSCWNDDDSNSLIGGETLVQGQDTYFSKIHQIEIHQMK